MEHRKSQGAINKYPEQYITLVNFQDKEYKVSMQLKYQYLITKIISENQKRQIITLGTLKFLNRVWSSIEIMRRLCNQLQSDQL